MTNFRQNEGMPDAPPIQPGEYWAAGDHTLQVANAQGWTPDDKTMVLRMLGVYQSPEPLHRPRRRDYYGPKNGAA